MTGYVRKDTSNNIADGNIINAADLDAEFDGVQDAFNASTGHKHDGTAGEGAPITAVGPTQDVTVSATLVAPKTTNTVDIGSSSLKFKDIYITGTATLPTVNATTVDTTNLEVTNIKAKDGTASASIADTTGVMTIASAILTTADINGGTIDGTAIGGTTAAAGSFTTLTTSSTVTHNGGTANGVAYLNGSKVLTTGSALTFDGSFYLGLTGAMKINSNGYKLRFYDATGSTGYGYLYTDGTNLQFDSGNTQPLSFLINGSEQMRLTSTGLGIGTSSPSDKLQIQKAVSTAYSGGVIAGGLQINTGYAAGDGSYGHNGITFYGDADNASFIYQIHNSSTDSQLAVGTNNVERMRLDSSGNLGIGTSSPSTRLHVTTGATGAQALFSHTSGTPTIAIGNSTTTYNTQIGYNVTSEYGYIQAVAAAGVYDDIAINPLGGNLGIGTSSPGQKLHVTSTSANQSLFEYTTASLSTPVSSATVRSTGALSVGAGAGIDFVLREGATDYTGARITTVRTDTSSNQALAFYTGGASAPTEKARIDSGGNLLIGSTSANAKLDVVSTATGSPTIRANYNGAVTYQNPHLLLQNQNQANGDKALVAAAFRTSGGSGYTPVAFGGIQTDNSNRYGAFAVYVSSSDNVDLSTQERMRIDSSGNLLVGGTTSSDRVMIQSSGANGLYVGNSASASGIQTVKIHLAPVNAFGTNWSTYEPSYIAAVTDNNSANSNLVFATYSNGATTERARITSAGTLLVGQSSKTTGATSTANLGVSSGITLTQGSYGGYIEGINTSGTLSGYLSFGSSYNAFNAGEVGLGTHGSVDLLFATNNTVRGRFDSSGNLLVGTTSTSLTSGGFRAVPANGGAGSTAIGIGHITGSASGDVYASFAYAGTTIGSITQNGTTAVAYNTSSDYRLKENIQPMTDALAKVAQLKPCTYNWKADGSAGEGFIAHELQAVVPQCVTGEKDAVDAEGKPVYQGIDTSFLVATLTAALQEAVAEINQLKARLDAANL